MRVRGWILAVCATVAVATVEAQIRLIPQAKVDSARNVVATDVGLRFDVGQTVDFGEIAEDGGAWKTSIKWQNHSDKPLIITRVTTSCGCLRVEYDRATVAVGGQGELHLTYYPQGHAGEVAQRIFIYTDRSAREPSAVLNLRGRVRATVDPSGTYPYARGALLLRQTWVRFADEGVQTERVACVNSGAKELKITADTLLSSPEIEVRTEPAVLAAGAEGDLVITYTPRTTNGQRGTFPTARPRLFLDGLGVAPRERAIEVFVTHDDDEKLKQK